MCVCVCVCVCMCVVCAVCVQCVCVHVCVHACVCMCVHVCVCMYVCMCMHVCVSSVYVYTCMCMSQQTMNCTCTCICLKDVTHIVTTQKELAVVEGSLGLHMYTYLIIDSPAHTYLQHFQYYEKVIAFLGINKPVIQNSPPSCSHKPKIEH